MQVVLVMFLASGERRSFSIVRDVTVVGRREDCDLRIPLGDVSRKHCRFVRDETSLRVEDLGSSNGTYINGERVQEGVVNPSDTVQVGPVYFVVQIDGNPTDEQLDAMAQGAPEDTHSAAPVPGEDVVELGEGMEPVSEDEVVDAGDLLEDFGDLAPPADAPAPPPPPGAPAPAGQTPPMPPAPPMPPVPPPPPGAAPMPPAPDAADAPLVVPDLDDMQGGNQQQAAPAEDDPINLGFDDLQQPDALNEPDDEIVLLEDDDEVPKKQD